MKKQYAIWKRREPRLLKGGLMVLDLEDVQVRILARAEGYAMVRRPMGMPFVVSEKDMILTK